MNRRPDPPDRPGRRPPPIPPRRYPQPPPRRHPQPPPRRPAAQPPRPPAQPPRPPAQPPRPPAQPWYLEHRRPQAPPPPVQPAPRATPPDPAPPPKPSVAQPESKRILLIGVGITGLLALAVLLVLALRGGVGGSSVELDIGHAQDGVRRVLTDPINGYGRDDVTDIRCNDGVNPTVRRGDSFTCTVTVDGAQRQVLVEFADDAGTYLVDRPR